MTATNEVVAGTNTAIGRALVLLEQAGEMDDGSAGIVKREMLEMMALDIKVERLQRMAKARALLLGQPERCDEMTALMLRGDELGLPPMQATESLHIINGQVVMSAAAMLALVFQKEPSAKVSIALEGDGDDRRAIAKGERANGSTFEVAFSVADRKRAGLGRQEKSNWFKYPDAMLVARAKSALCRGLFPDLISGSVIEPSEVEDIENEQPRRREQVTHSFNDTDFGDFGNVETIQATEAQPPATPKAKKSKRSRITKNKGASAKRPLKVATLPKAEAPKTTEQKPTEENNDDDFEI